MITTITLDQLDMLSRVASDAGDTHAYKIIRLAEESIRMCWIPTPPVTRALGLCVEAFNAMAQRIGMEWVDGDPFPRSIRINRGRR